MTPFRAGLKQIWHSLSWLDVVSTVATAAGLILAFLNASGGLPSFLKYLAVLAGIYLFIRFLGWWRNRLLWSLRNRLIVGYLFIALVPILLIVTLVFLVGRILYSQLGARSEEHTSELQSPCNLVCRLLLEKKKEHSVV